MNHSEARGGLRFFLVGLPLCCLSLFLTQLLNDGLAGWGVSFFLDGLYPVLWALYAPLLPGLCAVVFLGCYADATHAFIPFGSSAVFYLLAYAMVLLVRQSMRQQYPYTLWLIEAVNLFLALAVTVTVGIKHGFGGGTARLVLDITLAQCLLWPWSIYFLDALAALSGEEKLSLRWGR